MHHAIAVGDDQSSSAPLDRVRHALTTTQGLSQWWIADTQGDPDRVGGLIRFAGVIEMEVRRLEPTRVTWEVIGGIEDWIGTTLDFELRSVDGYTLVFFGHKGWPDYSDHMAHCSTKWATFLLSLKALCETGTGRPTPNDVKIDERN